MSNAVASSSKRPATPPSATANPAKRPRPSSSTTDSVHGDESDDEAPQPGEDLDDATRAKTERKEARTIRNRESAQRSRNQRKAHLAYLETRVVELEAENQALRSGETSPKPSRSASAEREASPANSVLSLANDLGIPPEIVSSSGGVNLATVTPPLGDFDVDVKPVIASPPIAQMSLPTLDPTLASLQNENAALRERVGLLENLVKQVVALSNLGGIPSTHVPRALAPVEAHPAETSTPIEWDALINAATQATDDDERLNATLSPPISTIEHQQRVEPRLPPSSGGDLSLIPRTGPAAGEETFNFGAFGNEFGTYGNGGENRGRAGQTSGYIVHNPFDLDSQQNVVFPQATFGEVHAEEAMGEDWDEGMKNLLEDIESEGANMAMQADEGWMGHTNNETEAEWTWDRLSQGLGLTTA